MSGECLECDGRGWHVGDCHPREECGVCLGSGNDDRGLSTLRRELAAEREPAVRGRIRQAIHELEDQIK